MGDGSRYPKGFEVTSYIYTFIREDLPEAQKIVQIGHACFEAGKRFDNSNHVSSLVLLSAKDEDDLKYIAEKIDRRGLEFYMFYEPDFGPMGYTAICTRPIINKADQNFFRRWNLYRSPVDSMTVSS